MGDDSTGGASASLNQTITEIMEFIEDQGPRPGGRGAKLREFLHRKIAKLAEKRYKRGFRRGHIESHKRFVETGAFPKTIRYVGEREFFKDQIRKVDVTSRIDRKR